MSSAIAQYIKHTCVKCGKAKTGVEGIHRFGGKTFCCEVCCGNTSQNEHKQKVANACEFC